MGTCFLILAASVAVQANPEPVSNRPIQELVRIGMTQAEVTRALGKPAHVARQILFRRHIEQWRYDTPGGIVEFECRRGEQPFVVTVLTPKIP